MVNNNHSNNDGIDLSNSKYDVSQNANRYVEDNYNLGNFSESRIFESINKIFQTIDYQEGLNSKANDKLLELGRVNENIDGALNRFKQLHILTGNVDRSTKPVLPTPTDEDYELLKHEELQSRNIYDIPSSPEISIGESGSDIDEVEIEINDKISRMVEKNYKDENIIKLKNVVNSTFDLVKFGSNPHDDRGMLMNVNDEIKEKSELLMDKLYGLVEAFT